MCASDDMCQSESVSESEAELTLFGEYLAIQRVRRLVHSISITNLLAFLLGQSFRKVQLFTTCRHCVLSKFFL